MTKEPLTLLNTRWGYLCLAHVRQPPTPLSPYQPACNLLNLRGLVFNFIKKKVSAALSYICCGFFLSDKVFYKYKFFHFSGTGLVGFQRRRLLRSRLDQHRESKSEHEAIRSLESRKIRVGIQLGLPHHRYLSVNINSKIIPLTTLLCPFKALNLYL